jgi:hypothetical protein
MNTTEEHNEFETEETTQVESSIPMRELVTTDPEGFYKVNR